MTKAVTQISKDMASLKNPRYTLIKVEKLITPIITQSTQIIVAIANQRPSGGIPYSETI